MVSRRINSVCFGLWAILALACFTGCSHAKKQPGLIVLGIDGMDPGFVERHWNVLPHLRALRDQGSFYRLKTTTPPQSPVAWSSFITGLDPAEHGLFDFVHRDPKTLQPFSSMSGSEQPSWTLPVGPYLLPVTPSRVTSFRKGTAFWKRLSDQGIPVSVIRMPTNYPPVESGAALSGMGTPDLRGTSGSFTFFTNNPEEVSHSVSGGQIVKVRLNEGHVLLRLEGPHNSLRKDGASTTAEMQADLDQETGLIRVKSGGRTVILREGEWSDWIGVDFSLISHVSTVRGMLRLYAKSLIGTFELYSSPINIDPQAPALPVSYPAHWAQTIARETGLFFTLGIPEDTSALRQNVFRLDEFLSQTRLIAQEESKLLRYALKHFTGGLLFFYISTVDENSHILWGKHDRQLLDVYRAADAQVGEVRHSFPEVPLIVLSDHGFTSFDRAVNLNAWLQHRGFLHLEGAPDDDTTLAQIDWASTQAYAIGLNALYLNLRGREVHGIVGRGEHSRALVANLREQLLAWRDPSNGRQIVESVNEERPVAANEKIAPDLIVGYAPGYRASWKTALGGTPVNEVEDNNDEWIADHCINAADVPGVLFTSWKSKLTLPKLQEVSGIIEMSLSSASR